MSGVTESLYISLHEKPPATFIITILILLLNK